MITLEEWAEVRRLHRAEGVPIKEIARRLGLARNTVRAALRADAPPSRERGPRGSLVDAVEPQVRALLAEYPRMPATVIAERIGWTRSLTILKDRVRELRPLFVPPDPADRVEYSPGELAQCDLWFPPVADPGRRRAGAGVAGAGDDVWVLAGDRRGDDPVPQGRGHPGRDVGDHRRLGPLPAHAGVGPRVRDRRAPASPASRRPRSPGHSGCGSSSPRRGTRSPRG